MEKPIVKVLVLPSGSTLIRFDSLSDAFYYDIRENNPTGISIRHREDRDYVQEYMKNRHILTDEKREIIEKAQKEMSLDQDFLKLVYKGKSQKRKFELNKFVGQLSMSQYAVGAEKQFQRGYPGAKKQTLNLAFQVGTFVGGNYTKSFIKILKVIMMCQAMNISVNIDMFDSDTEALAAGPSYTLINVAKSDEKLNFKDILVASHEEFFRYTLFNSYSAGGPTRTIGTFLDSGKITRDLSPFYDVIGGNMISEQVRGDGMISQIIKIGLK